MLLFLKAWYKCSSILHPYWGAYSIVTMIFIYVVIATVNAKVVSTGLNNKELDREGRVQTIGENHSYAC